MVRGSVLYKWGDILCDSTLVSQDNVFLHTYRACLLFVIYLYQQIHIYIYFKILIILHTLLHINSLFIHQSRDRGSSVGIATRYRLDGPRIESQWGRGFPRLSRPALMPTQPPIQWVPGLSRG
jgi:hypothetical protein